METTPHGALDTPCCLCGGGKPTPSGVYGRWRASVGVYKDAFSEAKYPYEGRWEVQLIDAKDGQEIAHKTIALVYTTRRLAT
jgi:hypothetical protein